MKNYFLKSVMLLTLVSLLFWSCSKEDVLPSSCKPIACKNSGISTATCGCDCPSGYGGVDCSTQLTPKKVFISKIRVLSFPNKDTSNSSWDALGNAPDISIQISDGIAPFPVLFSSDIFFPDAVSDGSKFFDFTLTTPFELSNVNKIYVISLWDYDGADLVTSTDDYMGNKSFYPYTFSQGFPDKIILEDTTNQLKFELSLIYQW